MTRILYMACDWIITIANIMAMILTFVSFIKECKKKQIGSLVLKVSILILMFIMLAAHYFQHSYAEVPNLVGLEYKNACALLADRNINFIDNEEYSGGNYFVVAQSLGNGNVVNVKGQEVIELVCERRYVGTDSENQKEEYSIINLGESVFFVQVGEIISIEISISTTEKYKFETTPFVLYCGFYSREKGDWVQISSMYVGAGEENYSVHIDTGLLGLSDGEYCTFGRRANT